MFKSDNHFEASKPNKPKSSTQQIQFQVAIVYDDISKMIQERQDLQIEMPRDVPTGIQRINLIKSVIGYLLEERKSQTIQQNVQDSITGIECKDCAIYEKNLQKIEGEVRNHIRTHQQLKLYQDGLQQKLEEGKKEKKQMEKKLQNYKKKYEEMKSIVNSNAEKLSKLQLQNEKIKQQMKGGKRIDQRKMNKFQTNKENLSEWNHKKKQRSSLQKRNQSTERMRVSVNVRSSKGIPITSKIMQDRAKEDKMKAIKSRIGFGY